MKITKNQRINQIADQLARQQGVISKLIIMVKEQNEAILMLEKLTDEKLRDQPKPQLKQLDQSVFKNMHERWKFAAIDADGSAHRFSKEVFPYREGFCYEGDDYNEFKFSLIGTGYDTSNWQNSLIERDIAKGLTGSDLARAMINRGDKIVLCIVRDYEHENDIYYDAITHCIGDYFDSTLNSWRYATPINNQGEPLTASEVGL